MKHKTLKYIATMVVAIGLLIGGTQTVKADEMPSNLFQYNSQTGWNSYNWYSSFWSYRSYTIDITGIDTLMLFMPTSQCWSYEDTGAVDSSSGIYFDGGDTLSLEWSDLNFVQDGNIAVGNLTEINVRQLETDYNIGTGDLESIRVSVSWDLSCSSATTYDALGSAYLAESDYTTNRIIYDMLSSIVAVSGYNEGYDDGYTDGQEYVEDNNNVLNDGELTAIQDNYYDMGYEDGYDDGYEETEGEKSIIAFAGSIIGSVLSFFLFIATEFSIFGVTLLDVIITTIILGAVIFVLKLVF